jgi:D-lyxose ketol-isomerase
MRRPMRSGVAKRRMQRPEGVGGEGCWCRRRKVLRVREKRLRSWGAMAFELFTFSATDEKCSRWKLTISCAFGLGSGSKEKKTEGNKMRCKHGQSITILPFAKYIRYTTWKDIIFVFVVSISS